MKTYRIYMNNQAVGNMLWGVRQISETESNLYFEFECGCASFDKEQVSKVTTGPMFDDLVSLENLPKFCD